MDDWIGWAGGVLFVIGAAIKALQPILRLLKYRMDQQYDLERRRIEASAGRSTVASQRPPESRPSSETSASDSEPS